MKDDLFGRSKKTKWARCSLKTGKCSRVVKVGGEGCGKNTTWPVCSKKAGNTEQDLCNMAGNVSEWVEDCWHQTRRRRGTFEGAPTDGSAWTTKCYKGGPFEIGRAHV